MIFLMAFMSCLSLTCIKEQFIFILKNIKTMVLFQLLKCEVVLFYVAHAFTHSSKDFMLSKLSSS